MKTLRKIRRFFRKHFRWSYEGKYTRRCEICGCYQDEYLHFPNDRNPISVWEFGAPLHLKPCEFCEEDGYEA